MCSVLWINVSLLVSFRFVLCIVCPSSLYAFCLPLWCLLFTPLMSSVYPFDVFCFPLWCLLITPLMSSVYPFDVFWLPLWCLLITPLMSSVYPFDVFWLPLWCLLFTPLMSSDYPFNVFWSSFFLREICAKISKGSVYDHVTETG